MTGQPTTPSAPTPDGAAFTAWLTASCERQGVPVTIRDPGIITQVAALLGRPDVGGTIRRYGRVSKTASAREVQTPTSPRRSGIALDRADTSRNTGSGHDPDRPLSAA